MQPMRVSVDVYQSGAQGMPPQKIEEDSRPSQGIVTVTPAYRT
jgi:hypothetical protein